MSGLWDIKLSVLRGVDYTARARSAIACSIMLSQVKWWRLQSVVVRTGLDPALVMRTIFVYVSVWATLHQYSNWVLFISYWSAELPCQRKSTWCLAGRLCIRVVGNLLPWVQSKHYFYIRSKDAQFIDLLLKLSSQALPIPRFYSIILKKQSVASITKFCRSVKRIISRQMCWLNPFKCRPQNDPYDIQKLPLLTYFRVVPCFWASCITLLEDAEPSCYWGHLCPAPNEH
jgi:hypothetical protein